VASPEISRAIITAIWADAESPTLGSASRARASGGAGLVLQRAFEGSHRSTDVVYGVASFCQRHGVPAIALLMVQFRHWRSPGPKIAGRTDIT
jgi:hypothetical protein